MPNVRGGVSGELVVTPWVTFSCSWPSRGFFRGSPKALTLDRRV